MPDDRARAPHDAWIETEVGERALVGLRRENYGLLRQRHDAIKARECRDHGWRLHHDGPDGTAVTSMSWVGVQGAHV